VKKGFGEKDVEAILQRIDRPTQDEARTTAAQILEVVHGLVQNMSVVMDGEQTRSVCNPVSIEYLTLQTAKHRLTMSGNALVRFVGENELVLCLTER
jgi:hypothetical protein